jgi:hypothetical protein
MRRGCGGMELRRVMREGGEGGAVMWGGRGRADRDEARADVGVEDGEVRVPRPAHQRRLPGHCAAPDRAPPGLFRPRRTLLARTGTGTSALCCCSNVDCCCSNVRASVWSIRCGERCGRRRGVPRGGRAGGGRSGGARCTAYSTTISPSKSRAGMPAVPAATLLAFFTWQGGCEACFLCCVIYTSR